MYLQLFDFPHFEHREQHQKKRYPERNLILLLAIEKLFIIFSKKLCSAILPVQRRLWDWNPSQPDHQLFGFPCGSRCRQHPWGGPEEKQIRQD